MDRCDETTDDPAEVRNEPDRQKPNRGISPPLWPWKPDCVPDSEDLIVLVAALAHGHVFLTWKVAGSLIALVCLLGTGSRRYAQALPGLIAAYAGDTLWALVAFLGIGLVLPRASTRTIACLAMAVSVAVEISQLYHAPWIDSIRQTTLGGLILGFGFLWSDLACYAVGVGFGVMIDIGVSALKERRD